MNIDNRVMVPVRDVAEKMGWEVTFETYPGNTLVDGVFQDEHHIMIQKMWMSVKIWEETSFILRTSRWKPTLFL